MGGLQSSPSGYSEFLPNHEAFALAAPSARHAGLQVPSRPPPPGCSCRGLSWPTSPLPVGVSQAVLPSSLTPAPNAGSGLCWTCLPWSLLLPVSLGEFPPTTQTLRPLPTPSRQRLPAGPACVLPQPPRTSGSTCAISVLISKGPKGWGLRTPVTVGVKVTDSPFPLHPQGLSLETGLQTRRPAPLNRMEGAGSQTLRRERPCSSVGRPASPPPAEDWLLPRPAVPSPSPGPQPPGLLSAERPPRTSNPLPWASWAPHCPRSPRGPQGAPSVWSACGSRRLRPPETRRALGRGLVQLQLGLTSPARLGSAFYFQGEGVNFLLTSAFSKTFSIKPGTH